jgi:hypothetical protein
MKPKRFEKKLALKKETVSNLNFAEMNRVNGGGGITRECVVTEEPECHSLVVLSECCPESIPAKTC